MKQFSKMSTSAKTIYVFFIYMIISGAGFVLVPNFFMKLLQFPEVQDVWPRALGMMTILLGCYYGVMARSESKEFFRATAYGRMTVIVFFTAFVLFKVAPPTMIALGVVDFAGAIWTLWALRSEKK